MNLLAARERFLVLYPEQDRLAHPQGCWNWYDRRSGKADAEAATLMAAVDQACVLYPVDRERVAVAGLSAGASMAALLATRYPVRFKAVAMHSGVAPGAATSPATALGAMRGRHVPPMPATAVGKAMGAAAVFTTLPPLLVLHGDADVVVSASNAGSTAAVWATATGAKPGAAAHAAARQAPRDARDRLQAQRPHLRHAVRGRRPGPCLERRRAAAALQRCRRAERHAPDLGLRARSSSRRPRRPEAHARRSPTTPAATALYSPERHETLFEPGRSYTPAQWAIEAVAARLLPRRELGGRTPAPDAGAGPRRLRCAEAPHRMPARTASPLRPLHADGSALLAFRGTQPDEIRDLATNLQAHQVDWPESGGRVHAGFARAARALLAAGARVGWKARRAGRSALILTGHSLGARARDADRHRAAADPAGHAGLAARRQHRVRRQRWPASTSLRLVDGCDLVTQLPPAFSLYAHAGPTTYISCARRSACTDPGATLHRGRPRPGPRPLRDRPCLEARRRAAARPGGPCADQLRQGVLQLKPVRHPAYFRSVTDSADSSPSFNTTRRRSLHATTSFHPQGAHRRRRARRPVRRCRPSRPTPSRSACCTRCRARWRSRRPCSRTPC